MSTKNWKKILTFALAMCMLLSFAACGSKPSEEGEIAAPEQAQNKEEVVITMLMGSENDPYARVQYDMLDRFNELYDGQYQINGEFAGSSQVEAMDKLKVLNAANQLPVIVNNLECDPGFAQTLAKNGRLLDLKPIFDEDPELMKYVLPVNYNSCLALSGGDALYFIPKQCDSYIGFYYNKELLKQAGYDSFPEDSWEDFWQLCDDLKAAGITPLTMDVAGGAWCSMLTCTSNFGATQEGTDLLAVQFPTDYDNPYMRETLENLKRIFDNYTTADAAGCDYANAANHFFSGDTAICANGPWMTGNFFDTTYCEEGFADKIGYATFPCHVMIETNDLIGSYAISAGATPEEQACAIAWMKFFFTEEEVLHRWEVGEVNPDVPLPEDVVNGLDSITKDYYDAIGRMENTLACFQTRWDPVSMYEVFAVELPNFVSGNLSADELIEKMNASAEQYLAELNS